MFVSMVEREDLFVNRKEIESFVAKENRIMERMIESTKKSIK